VENKNIINPTLLEDKENPGKKKKNEKIEPGPFLSSAVLIIERKLPKLHKQGVKQVLNTLSYVLEMNPKRMFIYGCVLTHTTLQFVLLVRRPGEGIQNRLPYTYYVMEKVFVDMGGYWYLHNFLNQPPYFYGLGSKYVNNNGLSLKNTIPFFGRSGIASVLSKGDSLYIEKQFRTSQQHIWRNEVMNLLKLRSIKFFKKMEENNENKNENDIGMFLKGFPFDMKDLSCGDVSYTPFPKVNIVDGCDLVLLEGSLGSAVCYEDGKNNFNNYIKRNRVNQISNLFRPLFFLLKVFADVGIVHRDIREANVTFHEDKLYLLDYGFCCPSDVDVEYAGGITCASDDVLDKLIKKQYCFKITSKDDVWSLIRMMVLLLNADVKSELDNVERPELIHTFASNVKFFWSQYYIIPNFSSFLKTLLNNKHAEVLVTLIFKCPIYFNFCALKKYEESGNSQEYIDSLYTIMLTSIIPLLKNYIDYYIKK
jgi:serine/threonine protein kinase